jgi:hypothetical protein
MKPLVPPFLPPPQQSGGQAPTALPNFHFIYLAPGLSVDYFFVAARRYWQTFRAIVIYDLSLIDYIPGQYSIAITTLARSDTAPSVKALIESSYGARLYHDLLVYDFVEDLQLTLDARAERNEPFGLPLISPSSP